MRIGVVGSRDFANLYAVRLFVSAQPRDTVIVSGGARGVDSTAIDEARLLGMPTEVYPADWATHGKRAGFLRNATIVDRSDEIAAFWNGRSRGTAHTIALAKRVGKPVRIVMNE